MTKLVLIVEKDVSLMGSVRDALAARGFGVEETTDGKGAPELIRKKKPDLVVLAVDLDAGQNGYILCKKLKSDDELKGVPVIIIGDPKGFAKHQQLKTRADDYLGKPFESDALVDRVGSLVGYGGPTEGEAESFDAASLLSDDGSGDSEEIAVDAGAAEAFGGGDAGMDMVDSMFDESPLGAPALLESDDTQLAPAEEIPIASDFSSDEVSPSEKTVTGFVPHGTAAPKPLPSTSRDSRGKEPIKAPHSTAPHGDSHESRDLKTKVAELTASLEDSNSRAAELETRVRELEGTLESANAEVEAAKSTAASGGKSEKDVFALKDSVNKKDKEILRLKTELNEKEKEIVELHDKENSLERQLSENSSEISKRDGQLKLLHGKVEQLTGDKKRSEQQLSTAKDEARAAAAKLSTIESEVEGLQGRLSEVETDLESTRAARTELETAKAQLQSELSEARSDLDISRGQYDERVRETDDLRTQLEQMSNEAEAARASLQSANEELETLRNRTIELEGDVAKSRGDVHKQRTRVHAHQVVIDRTREALQQALQTLDESPAATDEKDEMAEA
jgi:CheY-like chemotaxis protein